MRKMIAFVLLLIVALNLAVLLTMTGNKTDEKAICIKLPKTTIQGMLPGALPGLIKF